MRIVQSVFIVLAPDPSAWYADWVWGVPLIVLTVILHVFGLGLLSHRVLRVSSTISKRRYSTILFVVIVGATTLVAISMHTIEAGLWAIAYRLLSALPDNKSAMLYSLNALTSYGHTTLVLENRWQLMGAMEALDGWLLFGLTTAFLFAVLQKVWLRSEKSPEE
jgi:hypothetical protein